jgi:5-aminopentanamidase
LPELFVSGYQFLSQEEAQQLAEAVPEGPTVRRLIDIAKRRMMHLVAGLPERSGPRCYNSVEKDLHALQKILGFDPAASKPS